LIGYLILEYKLSNYLEIGLDGGKSFLCAAYAAKQINGMAYGIGSCDYQIGEGDEHKGASVHSDFNKEKISEDAHTYNELKRLCDEFSLTQNSKIFSGVSNKTANNFLHNKIGIGLLHISSNHAAEYIQKCIHQFLPLMINGGFIVLDNICMDSVESALGMLRKKYDLVFDNGMFTILRVENYGQKLSILEKSRLNILDGMLENREKYQMADTIANSDKQQVPTISVIVICYNQEMYIAECLQGIFAQKGQFQIELIIGDDVSQDATAEIIRNYIYNFDSNKFKIKILATDKNIGMTRNLQRCFDACTGEYIAICEGDDYWIDCYKLQKQMSFLKAHPECALCFNDIYIYFQNSGECITYDLQQCLDADVIKTRELVLDYYIGNLSCCMYDAQFMKKIPESLFDLYIGDWMFNIYYSQFGDIGHLKETTSVYRKHNKGVWSGRTTVDRDAHLYILIEEYNRFLDYNFDLEFSSVQKRIEKAYPNEFHKTPLDIAVIDNVFPHPLSAFRAEEFYSYLIEFNNSKIYSTGEAVGFFGNESLAELFASFKRSFPEHAKAIKEFQSDTVINTKLFYFVFLGNAYANIEKVEEFRTPFIFTLYPGGYFGIDNSRSDMMLKRVTASPCFRKVIVTQKITYDYLIKKEFCKPDQIEFIFGVVTPAKQIKVDYGHKQHFGLDKDTLDICFVAHKYTEKGIDKGYDVFIDVATRLSEKYPNIQFHVVGGFDEDVLDISYLKQRIKFYGTQKTEWFDEFYKDKDIILSPNVPFKIYDGSFDGFPTGSCIDAGLRETAIFCTDELLLNSGFFVDGEEIVIIPHDARQVGDIIESYYQNPEKIKRIAEKGCQKIKELYSFDAQISPRINILKKELEQAENSKASIIYLMRPSLSERLVRLPMVTLISMKKATPTWIKGPVKRVFRKVRSNEALMSFIKNNCPQFLVKLYYKIRLSS
jgi:glycosyltransferase involved in cell wall biosynthesis